jgi:hypothetical protein
MISTSSTRMRSVSATHDHRYSTSSPNETQVSQTRNAQDATAMRRGRLHASTSTIGGTHHTSRRAPAPGARIRRHRRPCGLRRTQGTHSIIAGLRAWHCVALMRPWIRRRRR